MLAGPNELGKSTILKAVRLALCEKHTSKDRKTVEALRPHNGGAPLVEVDFEIAGNTWRIRKQFLAGRSAELRSLSGSDVARGGDAETKLAELLAGKDAADASRYCGSIRASRSRRQARRPRQTARCLPR